VSWITRDESPGAFGSVRSVLESLSAKLSLITLLAGEIGVLRCPLGELGEDVGRDSASGLDRCDNHRL
jgi:hypothetical protein